MLNLTRKPNEKVNPRLKIWVTLKSSFSKETILKIVAVSNVIGVRFNITKEKCLERLASTINFIHDVAPSIKVMVDFGGQKKRICLCDETIPFVRHQQFTLIRDTSISSPDQIGIPSDVYVFIASSAKPYDKILISDGWQRFEINSIEKNVITCRALHDGVLCNNRGISVKGIYDTIKQDYTNDLLKYKQLSSKCSIDAIALSFVDSEAQIKNIRKMLPPEIAIMAKIESISGLQNAIKIIGETDTLVIARGDLLVESSYYDFDLVALEKILIGYCDLLGKPYIVATRVADSLEEQSHMSIEEIALLNYELDTYISPFVILLANETTVNEERAAKNIEIVNEAAMLSMLQSSYKMHTYKEVF